MTPNPINLGAVLNTAVAMAILVLGTDVLDTFIVLLTSTLTFISVGGASTDGVNVTDVSGLMLVRPSGLDDGVVDILDDDAPIEDDDGPIETPYDDPIDVVGGPGVGVLNPNPMIWYVYLNHSK